MRMIGSVVKKTWFSQPEELHNQIISDQMRAIHVDHRVGLLGFYPRLLSLAFMQAKKCLGYI